MWQFKTDKAPAFLDKLTQWISVVYDVDGTPLALGKDSSGWRCGAHDLTRSIVC